MNYAIYSILTFRLKHFSVSCMVNQINETNIMIERNIFVQLISFEIKICICNKMNNMSLNY